VCLKNEKKERKVEVVDLKEGKSGGTGKARAKKKVRGRILRGRMRLFNECFRRGLHRYIGTGGEG